MGKKSYCYWQRLGEINENLTSLYLAEKSRVLTNMGLRRICYCYWKESHDSFWLIQVVARESYSKQRSYTRQNFSRPNRMYTKLDLFQSGRIPRYHCTYLLTELCPSSEAANCAASQELPSILRNPKVHHRVHKSPKWQIFIRIKRYCN
jgi:hypothetical protein